MSAAASPVAEGQLLWTPDPARVAASEMTRYMAWLDREHGLKFDDYESLWRWSVAEPEAFWASVWKRYDVLASEPYERVLERPADGMLGTRWFPGARLNYAQNVLRREADAPADAVALHHLSELRPLERMTWRELGHQVRVLATALRKLGVAPGDRVASYLPNLAETVVAMLAAVSVGAVWASAAPEFGANTVIDRFGQIAPKLLFATDGYRFGGRDFDRRDEVSRIAAALPSLQHIVTVSYLSPDVAFVPDVHCQVRTWNELLSGDDPGREAFQFAQVESGHPLWVLFSSGTTGLPKAIVHGHGGILLEHLKLMRLHFGLGPQSSMFFHTTAGWMMWNLLIASLLGGGSAVFYDGSPMHPGPDRLWQLAADTGATVFGASPTFVQMMEKEGLKPGERFDLSRMEMVVVSGAPCQPETFEWFYRAAKRDLWVTSQSGGTEIASGFVGCSPLLPVHAGEIQCRMLGMDVHAWSDAGEELHDAVGELVVTTPFPSMPLYFWNDEGDRRYRDTYFDTFPGVWRHGDFIRIAPGGGGYIYGRSDATLNRHGVRIGSAEIYRIVEQIEGIADSLVVCVELPGGRFFMPLFVRLKPGVELDGAVRAAIVEKLRREASPRHVPDTIEAAPQIPYTLTGKKMEVPVRKLLLGAKAEQVASRDAMASASALDWYVEFAARFAAASQKESQA